MEFTLKEQETLRVVGTREQHMHVAEGPILTIAQQWGRFVQRAGEIAGRGPVTLGVCYGVDAAPGVPFEYITGALVSEAPAEIPEGMELLTLPPQLYAVFTHRGPIDGLGTTYMNIDEWVRTNGEWTREAAPDFELYDHRYSQDEPHRSEFDIYIPVRREA